MKLDKLKKLSRLEVLELFLAQSEELEQENQKLDDLRAKLEERDKKIAQASTIAEASLELSGAEELAKKVAASFVENVRVLASHQENPDQNKDGFSQQSAETSSSASTAMMGLEAETQFPMTSELRKEFERVSYWQRYLSVLRSTFFTLLVVASVAALAATLWIPVLRIYGNSMDPSLENGDIIVTVKENDFETGDIVAFYYNNKILVKRAIAQAGDWVDIDEDGTVSVNGQIIEEPYLDKKAYGDTNIELPYQVPEGKIFVLGDNRELSLDSRNSAIGTISEEQRVGKLIFRVWPLDSFGTVK